MSMFTGRVSIGLGAIKTLQELIQTAVAARTFPTQQQEDEEVSRWSCVIAERGTLQPVDGTLLMINAYGGVLNGKVNNHDGVTLAAGHFTGDLGTSWIPGQLVDLAGVELGRVVIYAAAATLIDLNNVIVSGGIHVGA